MIDPTIARLAMTAGQKVAAKTVTKFGACVIGTVAGSIASDKILSPRQEKMEAYIETEEFKSFSEKEQKKIVDKFNLKTNIYNGIITSIGCMIGASADDIVTSAINKADTLGGAASAFTKASGSKHTVGFKTYTVNL